MYEFNLQEFLNNELQLIDRNFTGTLPPLNTTIILRGETDLETAAAAGNMLSSVFGFLNSVNGTDYNYTEFYSCTNGSYGNGDVILMIESGFMDSIELREYILDSYVMQLVGG